MCCKDRTYRHMQINCIMKFYIIRLCRLSERCAGVNWLWIASAEKWPAIFCQWCCSNTFNGVWVCMHVWVAVYYVNVVFMYVQYSYLSLRADICIGNGICIEYAQIHMHIKIIKCIYTLKYAFKFFMHIIVFISSIFWLVFVW